MIAFLAVAMASVAHAAMPPQSVGPADPQAAEMLLKDSQTALTNRQYSEAARNLERFLARYPSHESNLEARFLLARALIETNRPAEAAKLLQEYQARVSRPSQKTEARLALIECYSALGKNSEMLATTREVLSQTQIDPLSKARALAYQGHGLFQLKKEIPARRALDQAQAALKSMKDESPEVRQVQANLESLRLKLQLETCSRMSDAKKPSESESLGIVTRGGQCLLQALLTYNSLVQWDDHSHFEAEGLSLYNGFAKLKRFVHETGKGAQPLVDLYDRYINEALQMVAHWKSSSLPIKERALARVRDQIQPLRSR